MKNLLIQQYEIGPLNNFLYLLGDPATKQMAMVDPAWDPEFLLAEVQRLGYQLSAVFLTHAHPDHVNGLASVQARHPHIPTYVSAHEAPFLTSNLRHLTPIPHANQLTLGSITFEVLHTPGHTPGCVCYLSQGNLISGDTLFIDGCGRCDLPGGDVRQMHQSLHGIIKPLPGSTIVYPGHNYGPTPTDTIAKQRQSNPYLQAASLEEFIGERM